MIALDAKPTNFDSNTYALIETRTDFDSEIRRPHWNSACQNLTILCFYTPNPLELGVSEPHPFSASINSYSFYTLLY